MPRKKILWVCSWYPGKTEPFSGDFIQRHARAAALYNDIYVIHVTGDISGKTEKTESAICRSAHLTEHIIYFKKTSSISGKWIAHYRWLMLFKRAIKKYIKENGNPEWVHVHVPIKAGITALWMKRKYKTPFVVTEHWGIYNTVVEDNYSSRSILFKKYTKKIIREAAAFITVSRYLAKGVNQLVTKKEYEVVPNVADTKLFFYREKSDLPFRFIHVSNMAPLKNVEGILRAFQLLMKNNTAIELLLTGDTDPAIRHYAKSLGLPEQVVFFRGEVPYEQVATEMQQSHCLVLFSNIENSPCVIGEALCCGLPVIATNVGGIPELLDDTNGLLVAPGNEEALAGAMQQIIEKYTTYDFKKIAGEASNKFSYSTVGKQLDKIYHTGTGRQQSV